MVLTLNFANFVMTVRKLFTFDSSLWMKNLMVFVIGSNNIMIVIILCLYIHLSYYIRISDFKIFSFYLAILLINKSMDHNHLPCQADSVFHHHQSVF